jgi:hypothetical protein
LCPHSSTVSLLINSRRTRMRSEPSCDPNRFTLPTLSMTYLVSALFELYRACSQITRRRFEEGAIRSHINTNYSASRQFNVQCRALRVVDPLLCDFSRWHENYIFVLSRHLCFLPPRISVPCATSPSYTCSVCSGKAIVL